MTDDFNTAFEEQIFYHATTPESAAAIVREGFTTWWTGDGDGRYCNGSCLGQGVYITCNWRVAFRYGVTLLRVGVKPGTKILNAAIPPDKKTLKCLQREFGREILKKSPWKCVPANKKLRRSEVICLLRYHYHGTWIKKYGPFENDGFKEWSKRHRNHSDRLNDFRSLLIRYGFHGYGNPGDEIGVVILDGHRIELLEFEAYLGRDDYIRFDEMGFDKLDDLAPVKAVSDSTATPAIRVLAKQIAEATASRRK